MLSLPTWFAFYLPKGNPTLCARPAHHVIKSLWDQVCTRQNIASALTDGDLEQLQDDAFSALLDEMPHVAHVADTWDHPAFTTVSELVDNGVPNETAALVYHAEMRALFKRFKRSMRLDDCEVHFADSDAVAVLVAEGWGAGVDEARDHLAFAARLLGGTIAPYHMHPAYREGYDRGVSLANQSIEVAPLVAKAAAVARWTYEDVDPAEIIGLLHGANLWVDGDLSDMLVRLRRLRSEAGK